MAASKQTDYKTLRTKLCMNQTEFWSRIGVTQSGGSRYEGGRQAPEPTRIVVDLAYGTPAAAIAKLAKLRGITVEELIAKVSK
ncbi:MAG TPA: helix-turn-helix transcriptional regulator [Bryobacteraceae bacterium]|nr:helix-turn-helix transcriptional regulator [Bryobacteraceae bacterium]